MCFITGDIRRINLRVGEITEEQCKHFRSERITRGVVILTGGFGLITGGMRVITGGVGDIIRGVENPSRCGAVTKRLRDITGGVGLLSNR